MWGTCPLKVAPMPKKGHVERPIVGEIFGVVGLDDRYPLASRLLRCNSILEIKPRRKDSID